MNWQIFICESCGMGSRDQKHCPYCGAGDWLRYEAGNRQRKVGMDTECYVNYWLCRIGDKCFEFFPGHPLDRLGMMVALTTNTLLTFNGRNYDLPMISYAALGADNQSLKNLSDAIIKRNLKPWDVEREFGITMLDIDMIDLIDVSPGEGSLKMYGGKMHAPRLQDLPIAPDATIELFDRPRLREYCGNDVETTEMLGNAMKAQIALRYQMSEEYGVDLRSKSDAQIAEAVMKKILPFEVVRPTVNCGAQFCYRPPSWMQFRTPYMQQIFAFLCSSKFTINSKGGVSPAYDNVLVDWGDDQLRPDAHGNFVERPAGWQHQHVIIGDTRYAMGIGGLHSTESRRSLVADATYRIDDSDVASYYPANIITTGIYPPQIGPVFQEIYGGWRDRRIKAKHAGDKKKANSLKTLLNGTFGKLGSIWSIFYAPSEMIQVTLGGQLALLMLIEMFEMNGLRVVSANTDGIVTFIRREQYALREQIVKWWEQTTGFEMETVEYRALHSRDVNSYVAITVDNEVKTKGAYAPPDPGPSGWPNPTTQICVSAAIEYLRNNTPVEATIVDCTDVRQFISVRNVRTGGYFVPGRMLDKKTTQRVMRQECVAAGFVEPVKNQVVTPWGVRTLADAYDILVQQAMSRREYLGKAVRWYYAVGSESCIVTDGGSKVAKTDGCRPMMQLSDRLPADIDYRWYAAEAKSLISDLGVKYAYDS